MSGGALPLSFFLSTTTNPLLFSLFHVSQLHADLTRRLGPPCLLSRPTRVLVSAWAAHLALPAPVLAWKKARNEAARALAGALAAGTLAPPFNRRPPDGGPGARVVGPLSGGPASDPPRRPVGSGGSGETDETAAAVAGPSGRGRTTHPSPSSLTHPPLPPACTLPTSLELQAALGAARERAAELEWRLGEAEARAEGAARAGGAAAAIAAAAAPSAARAVLDAARRRAAIAAAREREAASENWWVAAGSSPPSLQPAPEGKAGEGEVAATHQAARKRRVAPLAGDAGTNEAAGAAVEVRQTASPPSLATLRGRISALGGGGVV